jgi:uncharacterized protein (TIGR02284 family)
MASVRGLERSMVELLNDLIELDFDAIEALRAAIQRLKDPGDKERLRAFLADHQRHVRALSMLVRDLDARPPSGPDLEHFFMRGRVVLAGLLDDRAVMAAVRASEHRTDAAYQRALRHHHMPPHVRRTLEGNLVDEHRHHGWIERWLAAPAHAHAG